MEKEVVLSVVSGDISEVLMKIITHKYEILSTFGKAPRVIKLQKIISLLFRKYKEPGERRRRQRRMGMKEECIISQGVGFHNDNNNHKIG